MNYLIHSALLTFLFYGVYQMFLKKETFHQFKRAYLLLVPVLSLLLPLVTVGTIQIPDLFAEPTPVINELVATERVEIVTDPLPISIEQEVENLTITEYAWMAYTGVGFVFLLLFILKIARVRSLIAGGVTKFLNNLFVTRVQESGVAFSFFNHVVLDEQFDEDITKSIVEHERIHIEQKHSWDLMFYEVLRVVFWFHPVSHLAQRELQVVHEYIVDQKLASNQSIPYQESLLAQTLGVTQISLVNSFNKKSNLKKRIAMISKTKSQPTKLLKLLWIIPIVCASLIYTACTDDVIEQETAQQKKSEIIDLKDFKEGQVDFYKGLTEEEKDLVEKYPISETKPSKEFYEYLQTEEGEILLTAWVKVNHNGTTYAIDRENGDQLISIIEHKDRDPIFRDVEQIKAFDIPKDKEMILHLFEILSRDRPAMASIDSEEFSILKGEREDGNSPWHFENVSYDENGNEIIEVVEIEELSDPYSNVQPISENITHSVPFSILEKAPTYPGCENLLTNEERKKCMSDNISRYVSKEFNTGLAADLGLKGRIKINVQFKIDSNGNIIDIASSARHQKLAEETFRVISSLPTMQPGEQRGEKVSVIYALPIIFQVQDN
ncbi:hypothetical protein BST97_03540 [Nonlabens spongiae]|uniref:BlaR1 peptidase M56 n=1 Tax=Nonlabens spongiae TaxID=331648 RepID=A0A1W6MHR6_9FLAO|nr:M56 family metallopeptidase [Nonlabens spongiae]ARN77135.1 hypothetical protein BST97_03540 [Nonlabens spongiae]